MLNKCGLNTFISFLHQLLIITTVLQTIPAPQPQLQERPKRHRSTRSHELAPSPRMTIEEVEDDQPEPEAPRKSMRRGRPHKRSAPTLAPAPASLPTSVPLYIQPGGLVSNVIPTQSIPSNTTIEICAQIPPELLSQILFRAQSPATAIANIPAPNNFIYKYQF